MESSESVLPPIPLNRTERQGFIQRLKSLGKIIEWFKPRDYDTEVGELTSEIFQQARFLVPLSESQQSATGYFHSTRPSSEPRDMAVTIKKNLKGDEEINIDFVSQKKDDRTVLRVVSGERTHYFEITISTDRAKKIGFRSLFSSKELFKILTSADEDIELARGYNTSAAPFSLTNIPQEIRARTRSK